MQPHRQIFLSGCPLAISIGQTIIVVVIVIVHYSRGAAGDDRICLSQSKCILRQPLLSLGWIRGYEVGDIGSKVVKPGPVFFQTAELGSPDLCQSSIAYIVVLATGIGDSSAACAR